MTSRRTSACRCSGKTVINSTKSRAAMMAEMMLESRPKITIPAHTMAGRGTVISTRRIALSTNLRV